MNARIRCQPIADASQDARYRLEVKTVRTTGDWHPNFDGDMVEVRLWENPPPPARQAGEVWNKARQEYYDAHRGQKSWRISVWGKDDTGTEKLFWVEHEARAVFDALDLVPSYTTLIRDWDFQSA